MMRSLAYVVALAIGALGEPPAMPREYSAVLVLKMPYINFSAPIRVATSSTAQKIVFYDGLEVDVISAAGAYKYAFNNSKRVCMFSPPIAGPTKNLEADDWAPGSFVPDLSTYSEEGTELIGGRLCQKFSSSAPHGSTGTMNDHIDFYWDPVLNKPVRWHMHSRLVPMPSHTDEYIVEFLSFQEGTPAPEDLALPKLCSEQAVVGSVSIQIRSFLESARALHNSAPVTGESSLLLSFDDYLKQHGKAYAPKDYARRKAIFAKNMASVNELNRKHDGQATFKINSFMDMTKDEVMSFRGGKRKGALRSQRRSAEHLKFVSVHETTQASDLPPQYDWRTWDLNVMTAVKDQGFCGSCWTYGVTETAESLIAIQTKSELVKLSEQFVVDCTWTNQTGSSGRNSGCDGGDSDVGALEIVRKFGGAIPTAEAYGSYLSVDGYCKDISNMAVGARITGWVDIKERDDTGLMQALVDNGPMSIGIQVPPDMLYYDTGVLKVDDCKYNASNIDHAVVLAGYGTDETGTDYWLVRNSWSTNWGDQGYIKIARGDFDCCVSCQAGYPKVAVGQTRSVVV